MLSCRWWLKNLSLNEPIDGRKAISNHSGPNGLAGRTFWTLAAQVISSTSNFLLTLFVLSIASLGDFAIFSLCFTTWLLVCQLSRSAAGLPLMILYSEATDEDRRQDYQAAVGVSVATGCVAAIPLLTAAIVSSKGQAQFAVIGLFMPLLLFQDTLRHLAFAIGRPQIAAASDALWLGLQVAASLMAILLGQASTPALLAVWAMAGTVSGLAAGVHLKVYPRLGRFLPWLRLHATLCRRLVVEFVLNSGSYYLLLYGLVLLAGLGQLGRLRAAQTLIGPVIVILLGGNALGVPESVRMRNDGRPLKGFAVTLSSSLAIICVVWGILAYLLLPVIGPDIFPDTWQAARPLIPLLSLFAAAVGVSAGANGALRAADQNSWILKCRATSGALALLAGLPASALWGAQGTLMALALSEVMFAFRAWAHLGRAMVTYTDPAANIISDTRL